MMGEVKSSGQILTEMLAQRGIDLSNPSASALVSESADTQVSDEVRSAIIQKFTGKEQPVPAKQSCEASESFLNTNPKKFDTVEKVESVKLDESKNQSSTPSETIEPAGPADSMLNLSFKEILERTLVEREKKLNEDEEQQVELQKIVIEKVKPKMDLMTDLLNKFIK